MRNAYRTLIMAAMVIWLLGLATKQTMMQNTGGMLAMMMESVPVILKTNWKAPGRKTHRDTKIINTDLQGKVGILVASHLYSLL